MLTKFIILLLLNATALHHISAWTENALNVKEIVLTQLKLSLVSAQADLDLPLEELAWVDADSMRFLRMDNAAARLDSTQSMESADNACGMKFMTKDSESAEFPAIPRESMTSALENAFAYLNTSKWTMELAISAQFTPLMILSQRPASASQDTLKILDFAPLPAMLMKSMSTVNASAKKVTILLDILADFALQLKFMIPPIESATAHAKSMKFGILLLELAAACLDITWSTECAVSAIQRLKSTIKKLSAVTVLKAIKNNQDKAAMVFVLPSAPSMRTGSWTDVSVSPATI